MHRNLEKFGANHLELPQNTHHPTKYIYSGTMHRKPENYCTQMYKSTTARPHFAPLGYRLTNLFDPIHSIYPIHHDSLYT